MITPLYAALLIALLLVLSVRVITQRRKLKAPLGDGDDYPLKQRMRAHGNFVEYTPLFLIGLGLVESGGFPAYGLHLLGAAFLLGRVLHAYGISHAERYQDGTLYHLNYRVYGMVLTLIVLAVISLILLVQWAT
jgi:uncharacterized membrane protein YecN with MAPEG domain